MPSGYTCIIGDNDATFEEFVWRCARAFGALVLMRDDPMDAPVPDEFKASTYYAERIEEARAEIKRLGAMTAEECDAAARADHAKAVESCQRNIAKDRALADKYRAMLARVADWTPPTPEHVGLKEFMAQQIRASLDFDCGMNWTPPALLPGAAWREEKVREARRSVQCNTKYAREEAERTEGRNRWIKALRESVPPPVTRRA